MARAHRPQRPAWSALLGLSAQGRPALAGRCEASPAGASHLSTSEAPVGAAALACSPSLFLMPGSTAAGAPLCLAQRAEQQQGCKGWAAAWQYGGRSDCTWQLPGRAGSRIPTCHFDCVQEHLHSISPHWPKLICLSSLRSTPMMSKSPAVRQCKPACLLPVQRGVPDLLQGAPGRRGRVGWRRQGCARGPGTHCGCCGPCPDDVTLLIPGQAGDGLLLHSQELAGPASNLGPAPRQALTHIHVHAGEWKQGPIAVQGLQSCARITLMTESIIRRARVAS